MIGPMKYQTQGNYFDGAWVDFSEERGSVSESVMTRTCPGDTETVLWQMQANYAHVESATNSAVRGYHDWRKIPLEQKISFLKRYQEQLLVGREAAAEMIALESGKPLWEAKTEVAAVISKVDVTIGESLPRIEAQTFPEIMPHTTGHLLFKPLGPVLVIGPFNFPCHLANTQILSALLSGNSVIFKPSEKVARSAEWLIDSFHAAGFPPGVVNLVQGDGEVARRLVNQKDLKGIYFTGSKEVGISVLKDTYRDLSKLVALELGGKNPAILHRDADLETALVELVQGAFLTTGQRCTSTGVVLIHRSIADQFIARFHQVAKNIIVDHPVDYTEEPLMGPLVDQKALDSYLVFMGMAKREGFEEVMRGKHLTDKPWPGHYVSPSIHLASRFDPQSYFFQSEIFGPNCTFIPYDDIDEAIEMANATDYGLAASLFSKDRKLFEKCRLEIDAGLLNFNRATCGASAKLPFGGVKSSGNHRPMAVAAIDSTVYPLVSLEVSKNRPAPKMPRGVRELGASSG